jgi:hypothetical protein
VHARCRWRRPWHVLNDGEFELSQANAAHVKNVPGRKTDVCWQHAASCRLETLGLGCEFGWRRAMPLQHHTNRMTAAKSQVAPSSHHGRDENRLFFAEVVGASRASVASLASRSDFSRAVLSITARAAAS